MATDVAAEEAARKDGKPPTLSGLQVAALSERLFGVALDAASVRELDSYDDRNFYGAEVTGGREWVLKVHNGVESAMPALLDAQNALMKHLAGRGVPCNAPAAAPKSGAETVYVASEELGRDGKGTFGVRLLRFVPGTVAANAEQTPELLRRVGAFVGRVGAALEAFEHPALHRAHLWDLASFPEVGAFVHYIEDPARRALVDEALRAFEEKVVPVAKDLPRGALQNDANDQNILVDDSGKVAGLLDFGDALVSWRVNEIAICLAYFVMGKHDPVAVAAYVLEGFVGVRPLLDVERAVLPTLVRARIATSTVLGAYSIAQDPTNDYLRVTAEPGWTTLAALSSVADDEFLSRCGI